VRVDVTPLLTGTTDPGEVCEIPGVGPVPVSHARRVLSHGLLELVIHDGTDVRRGVTRRRRRSAHRVRRGLRDLLREPDLTLLREVEGVGVEKVSVRFDLRREVEHGHVRVP